MAAAGGFRLAFWCEERDHHGARLDRALARYVRYADVRPPRWPETLVAAFARFLVEHTPAQEGPERGMAYDVQRFNELTKQMSAYAHYTRAEHLELAAGAPAGASSSTSWPPRSTSGCASGPPTCGPQALVRRASGLLDSEHPNHQAAGRIAVRAGDARQQLAERDRRLLASQHPGSTDGRYRAACAHAERWGLAPPPGRWRDGG